MVVALTKTSVAVVLVIFALSPLAAAVMAWILIGERVRNYTWLAIAVTVAGVAFMVSGPGASGSTSGALIALVIPLAFGYGTVMIRRHSEIAMAPAMLLSAAISSVISLPFAHPFDITRHDLLLLARIRLRPTRHRPGAVQRRRRPRSRHRRSPAVDARAGHGPDLGVDLRQRVSRACRLSSAARRCSSPWPRTPCTPLREPVLPKGCTTNWCPQPDGHSDRLISAVVDWVDRDTRARRRRRPRRERRPSNATSAASSSGPSCSGVRGPIKAADTAGCGEHETERQLDHRQSGRFGDLPERDRQARVSAHESRVAVIEVVRLAAARDASSTEADWYLPVSHPPFNGAHASTPTSCCRHHGNTSTSMLRTSSEYGGCSLHGTVTPRCSARDTASSSCETENVDVPTERILPACTSSSNACKVSSIGVSGSGRCIW